MRSLLIGGNGTMGAVANLRRGRGAAAALQVIGIPKTIDNDLAGCDVTPGYGSAARYLAITTQEIGLDLRAMRGFDQVAIVEVMGRHAGWLAAATALARQAAGDPPHLILLPEAPVAIDELLAADRRGIRRGSCVDRRGGGCARRSGRTGRSWWTAPAQDPSGQRVFSMSAGASASWCAEVQERLGLRCRQIKLNTAQRASRLLASPVDRLLAPRWASPPWRRGRWAQTGVLGAVRDDGKGGELLDIPPRVGRNARCRPPLSTADL